MSTELDEKLSPSELGKWKQVLTTIRKGRAEFWNYVAAVAQVREERLWRAEYKSFDDFCQREVGWERRYTNQLIESCQTRQEVGVITPTLIESGVLKTESHFRQLRDVPEEQMQQVLDRVVEKTEQTGKPVTAKMLKETVNEVVNNEPEQYEDVDDEPEPQETAKERAAKMKASIKSHNAAMMRLVDDLHAVQPRPKVHAAVHLAFREIHTLIETWK